MKHIKDWSLKNKIILHVSVIGAITAFFLTFLYIKTQRNIIHQTSQQKAELISSMIESSIHCIMKEGDIERLSSYIQEVSNLSDIRKIRILSSQGKISHSSLSEEIGSFIPQSSLQKLKTLLSNKSQFNLLVFLPKSTIQGFHVIKNNESCFRCHDRKNDINGILETHMDYSTAAALLKKSQVKGIFIALGALFVLTFIILRLFEKIVNKPLSQLKNKIKKVQEGELNTQFPVLKKDEIGSLAESFNNMVRRLKEANQKIEDLFNRQMEKAEHLASIGELAAGLAHEIKNPIAGMKGALEIINQKTDESDPKKEIFTEILLQIDKIDHIIQDLLSYAKPKEMRKKLVNPNQCIENAIKLAKPQLKDKDIHIDFQGIKNEAQACLDEDKIQEVILNLILNSIYAIEKKGEISIKLDEKNESVLKITLKDNGVGIKKENLFQIFNPFFTTKTRGTGLGLSICKKIINAHQGSIHVESEEKKGTTFTIELPVLKPCD